MLGYIDKKESAIVLASLKDTLPGIMDSPKDLTDFIPKVTLIIQLLEITYSVDIGDMLLIGKEKVLSRTDEYYHNTINMLYRSRSLLYTKYGTVLCLAQCEAVVGVWHCVVKLVNETLEVDRDA